VGCVKGAVCSCGVQSKHLALIGDHKQLPPVIASRKAQAGGLGVSLFERLKKEKGMLTVDGMNLG
jgi:superfamily I DNA and/or RNA helicase